jgi:hypothetical protein
MTAIVTPAEITAHLESMTAVELRKLGATMGIKGASKGKKADLVKAIADMRIAEAEALAAAEAAKATPAPKKGKCTECGRKLKANEFGELCEADRTYGEWENTHGDEGHEALLDSTSEQIESQTDCPVCHPELDARKARKTGRSRAGMVIVAKGTEIHKSETFRAAAVALGYQVEIEYTETDELDEDGEAIIRHHAVATKAGTVVEGSWIGKAWDYANAGAGIGGKARKVRNLKEALRILAGNA